MLYSILFIFYVILAILIERANIKSDNKKKYILLSFIVVTFMVGLRSYSAWADSGVYAFSFQNAPLLKDFSFKETPVGYREKGFYLLTSCIKTIKDNTHFFFLTVSGLSFFFLYKFNRAYCLFPILAFAVYMARFLAGRNNMQIRAGLAIPLVLFLGTKFVHEKKLLKFLITIFLGYCLHHSMIIALPLYLANYFKLQKIHVIIGLLLAFIVAIWGGNAIKHIMSSSSFIQDLARSYINDDSVKKYSATLANPMIYYQCCFLLLFTIYEKRLRNYVKCYDLIRFGYFYSTVLLIILYDYAIVAARTSTIFATYEMVIVPSLILAFRGTFQKIYLCVLVVLYSVFFILNWKPVQLSDMEVQQAIQIDR